MRIAFLGDSLTEGRPGESFLARLGPLLPGDLLLNHGRAGDTIPGLLARLEAGELAPADLAVVWIGTNDAFLGDWYLPPLSGTGRDPSDGNARAADSSGNASAAGSSGNAGEGGAGAGGAGAGDRAARTLRPLYERILDLTLDRAPLAVCVPPVLPDPFEQGGIADRVAGIGAMTAAVAAARGPRARLFELAPAFAAASARQPRAHFTLDGVHLNAGGADVVAAAFRGLVGTLRDLRHATPPPP
jgi:lysophospholipase L1-like esterase